jgi:hypothetical protein
MVADAIDYGTEKISSSVNEQSVGGLLCNECDTWGSTLELTIAPGIITPYNGAFLPACSDVSDWAATFELHQFDDSTNDLFLSTWPNWSRPTGDYFFACIFGIHGTGLPCGADWLVAGFDMQLANYIRYRLFIGWPNLVSPGIYNSADMIALYSAPGLPAGGIGGDCFSKVQPELQVSEFLSEVSSGGSCAFYNNDNSATIHDGDVVFQLFDEY